MADNFSQATVQPSVPAALISPMELELLTAFGFDWVCEDLAAGGSAYYLYVPESLGFAELTLPAAELAAEGSGLGAYLRGHLRNLPETGDLELVDLSTDMAFDLLQRLLHKDANRSPDALEELVVMGAFTCSRMRAGEFGGWVVRITRDNIQASDTYTVLEAMRSNSPPAPRGADDAPTFTDRADIDTRARRFREIARSNGFDVRADCMPWAEGAGIVHVATWTGDENLTDSVYVSWEFCCWEMNLSVEAGEPSRDMPDIVDVNPNETSDVPAEGTRPGP